MQKIVFFDIDGTLVTENNHLPQSTKQAINELKANGIYQSSQLVDHQKCLKRLWKNLNWIVTFL